MRNSYKYFNKSVVNPLLISKSNLFYPSNQNSMWSLKSLNIYVKITSKRKFYLVLAYILLSNKFGTKGLKVLNKKNKFFRRKNPYQKTKNFHFILSLIILQKKVIFDIFKTLYFFNLFWLRKVKLIKQGISFTNFGYDNLFTGYSEKLFKVFLKYDFNFLEHLKKIKTLVILKHNFPESAYKKISRYILQKLYLRTLKIK